MQTLSNVHSSRIIPAHGWRLPSTSSSGAEAYFHGLRPLQGRIKRRRPHFGIVIQRYHNYCTPCEITADPPSFKVPHDIAAASSTGWPGGCTIRDTRVRSAIRSADDPAAGAGLARIRRRPPASGSDWRARPVGARREWRIGHGLRHSRPCPDSTLGRPAPR